MTKKEDQIDPLQDGYDLLRQSGGDFEADEEDTRLPEEVALHETRSLYSNEGGETIRKEGIDTSPALKGIKRDKLVAHERGYVNLSEVSEEVGKDTVSSYALPDNARQKRGGLTP